MAATILSRKNHSRENNLRQRLLKASRKINNAIVDSLQQRGFNQLQSTHTALLSHLDLEGSNLTTVAQRAGMTKQAMGRLADQLTKDNYISSCVDKQDRRAIKLLFTPKGLDLMSQSFEIMTELENACIKKIGEYRFKSLLKSLSEIEQLFN